jgi:putative membrane protein
MEIDYAYWGLQTLAMILTALLLPGFRCHNPLSALLTVVAIGFVNSRVWSAALFFHIPDNVSIEVLTLLFVNAVIFAAVVKLVPGIYFDKFWPMLVAPLVFTLSSILISSYFSGMDWEELMQRALVFIAQVKEFFESQLNSRSLPVSSPE